MKSYLIGFFVCFCIVNNTYSQEFGLELPIAINSAKILVPDPYVELVPSSESSGPGFDAGLGVSYISKEKFGLRGGLKFSSFKFHPTINTNEDGSDYVIEKGRLSYYGGYFRMEYSNKIFAGIGFEFLLNTKYKADQSIYHNNEHVTTNNNVNSSILTDEFLDMLVLLVNLGYEIPIQKNMLIKPFFSLGLSSSIYNTGELDIVNNPYVRIYYDDNGSPDFTFTPVLSVGLSTEYRLTKRNNVNKRRQRRRR